MDGFDHQDEHASQYEAIRSIAQKIGCSGETLHNWVRQAERDQGRRAGPTTDERERIKALERENRELRQANGTWLNIPPKSNRIWKSCLGDARGLGEGARPGHVGPNALRWVVRRRMNRAGFAGGSYS